MYSLIILPDSVKQFFSNFRELWLNAASDQGFTLFTYVHNTLFVPLSALAPLSAPSLLFQ